MKSLLLVGLCVCSIASFGSTGPASFEKLKSLEGSWSGNATVDGGTFPTTVIYRVTSNGHAVEETIAPHSIHEMITMYYLDGNSLVLTHYCSMGNQPHMKQVVDPEGDTLSFDFDGGSNIAAGAAHMHSAKIKLLGADKIETQWFAEMGGKPLMHITMELHRSPVIKK